MTRFGRPALPSWSLPTIVNNSRSKKRRGRKYNKKATDKPEMERKVHNCVCVYVCVCVGGVCGRRGVWQFCGVCGCWDELARSLRWVISTSNLLASRSMDLLDCQSGILWKDRPVHRMTRLPDLFPAALKDAKSTYPAVAPGCHWSKHFQGQGRGLVWTTDKPPASCSFSARKTKMADLAARIRSRCT